MSDIRKELIEALHYIKKFRGRVFVVKFGGDIFFEEEILESVALDLALLHELGIHLVVVHGAGVLISANMEKFGVDPKFIRGERVTNEETLDLMIGSLQHVNQKLVANINRENDICVGLTAGLFEAEKKNKELGFVGEVTSINSKLVGDLFDKGYLVVTTPIGIDKCGRLLNINADVAAGEISRSLEASKLIMLTQHVEGVLNKEGKLIRKLSVSEAKDLIKKGVIAEGMIPKVESGIKAISEGVDRVHIVKAGKHAILEELLTEEGTGTLLVK